MLSGGEVQQPGKIYPLMAIPNVGVFINCEYSPIQIKDLRDPCTHKVRLG
jgi:hypothetical protein